MKKFKNLKLLDKFEYKGELCVKTETNYYINKDNIPYHCTSIEEPNNEVNEKWWECKRELKDYEVMEAFEDGAEIGYRSIDSWVDCEDPSWNWAIKYQIKKTAEYRAPTPEDYGKEVEVCPDIGIEVCAILRYISPDGVFYCEDLIGKELSEWRHAKIKEAYDYI